MSLFGRAATVAGAALVALAGGGPAPAGADVPASPGAVYVLGNQVSPTPSSCSTAGPTAP